VIALIVMSVLLPHGCYAPPLAAPVVDPFRVPACAYCPGNRGLEYAPAPGTPVTALSSGTVTFSGSVAGTRYVVVQQPDGIKVTYGRLAGISVSTGATVVTGGPVGTTTDRFFLGLRRGDEYIDPAPLLGRLRRRAHLVPTDGGASRPAPPPSLICMPPR
jgi:murein DD-endopeptidase MepM/ murein hydrolase activator NlpD